MPIYYATIPLILNVGVRADQPLATDVGEGTLYSVSDEDFLIERSDGAAWSQWGPTPGTSGGNALLKASVSLTNAQVKALPTTPFQLVATPGAGFYLAFWRAELKSDFSAGAYTNVNTTFSEVFVQTGTAGLFSIGVVNDSTTTPAVTSLTSFMGASDRIVTLGPYLESIAGGGGFAGYVIGEHSTGGATNANMENKALFLQADNNGSGDFTGGNASNNLDVVVYYTIEAIAS